MFTIWVDGDRRLLEVKLSGLLTVPELVELRAAMRATLRRHDLRPGAYLLLIDATENPIQPREVHEELNSFNADPDILPARLAIWTGDAASRMQARRADPRCPMQLFRRREEAFAWLIEAGELAPVESLIAAPATGKPARKLLGIAHSGRTG